MHPLLFVSTTLRKIRFAGVIKKKKKRILTEEHFSRISLMS